MLKVGLTGGIACGKSVVADMFAARGVHVVKADEIAHRLMRPGEAVYAAVVEKFGPHILDQDGSINRQKLAAVAFAARQPRIEELNRLVHPAVVAEQDRWSEQIGREDPAGLAMVEAALIFEAGLRGHFDRIVVVVCNPEQKIERLALRLGIDLAAAGAEVERRSRAQWPDEEKARLADMVIRNAGSLDETAQQVGRVFAELKRQAVLTT
jgi:dephospho-CoA kinase